MPRRPAILLLAATTFVFVFAILSTHGLRDCSAGDAAKPAENTTTNANANANPNRDDVAAQTKNLQKQIAELQKQMSELKAPRIVAAGTATIHIGPQQDNKTNVRVKLPAEIVAQLAPGGKYLAEVTLRYPTGSDYFVAYWRPATDGIDILLADPSLVGVVLNPDRRTPYYVDWIVVQK